MKQEHHSKLLSIVDDLDAAVRYAHGLEFAVAGIPVKTIGGPLCELCEHHTNRLVGIANSLAEFREAVREPASDFDAFLSKVELESKEGQRQRKARPQDFSSRGEEGE